MSILSSIRAVLGFLFRRLRAEREMEEELRSHLRSRADDLERQGLPRAEAERQARVEFGGYQRYKEECRETLGTRLLGELIADLRYGLRQLRRNPGFTALAVLALGLGLGVNTGIFSLAEGVLYPPFAGHDPSHLAAVYTSGPDRSGYASSSYPDYAYYRERSRAFSAYPPTPAFLSPGPIAARRSFAEEKLSPATTSMLPACSQSAGGSFYPRRATRPARLRWWW